MKRARIIVTGVVQKVFFRQSALEKAYELQVKGWIRNLANGSVMAEAEGRPEDVERFITWCYKGPDQAIVTGVEVEYLSPEGDLDFIVLR